MTDQEIISQLREGREHKALVELYKHLPKVERMVRDNSGTRADAKDLFQDALMILHRKAQTADFTLNCAIGTYLYAICRNRWQEELRRRGRFTQELDAAADEPADLASLLAEEGRYGLAERALRSLGAKCLDLLQRFYVRKEPMLAIAKAIGLAGEGAAKTRKYKCLEEARHRYRELLAKDPFRNSKRLTMRDELHLIELADRYLHSELNETDRKAFEERLRTNAELRELVEDQRVLQQGIERLALRPAVDLAYRSYRFGKWMPGMGGAVIVAIVSVGGWMIAQSASEHDAIVSKDADITVIESTVTLSDSTDASNQTLVALTDIIRDTTLFTGTEVAQDVFVDRTTTTNEEEVGVDTYVIKRTTHDPAPRRIVEALTEKLDSQPMFVGGNEALSSYLLNNLRYPPQAEARDVQGRVTISFVILSDGSVYDARIVSGIGSGCDEEALRVIKAMPKWVPGYLDGRPVGVRMTMPIVFRSSPPIMY